MRRILGAAIGALALIGVANAQEVPLSHYVGDGATGVKVYGNGYFACDVATDTCKTGNGVEDWNTRSLLAGKAAGADVTIAGHTAGNAVVTDASGNLIDGGVPPGGAGGSTTINVIEQPTGVRIESDTGGDDTMALADDTNAGAMSPAHFTRVEGVEDGAQANRPIASTAQAEAGAENTVVMTPLRTAEAIAALGGGGGASQLSDLSDVGTPTPTARHFLVGDGADFDSRALEEADVPDLTATYATDTQGDLADTSYQTDGDVGFTDQSSPDSVTTTWTPDATNSYRLRATVTDCTGLVISPPTGTMGSGVVSKVLHVNNSCGGALGVTFSGFTVATDYLTATTIADGEARAFEVLTEDTGTSWLLEGGYLDFTSLPAMSLDVADVILGQSTTPTPDAWGSFTVQDLVDYIEGLLSIAGTQITHAPNNQTADYTLLDTDKGKIVTCNHASGMDIDVDTAGITWADGDIVYFMNKGVGDCTIQDGTAVVDVTISVGSGQSGVLGQYKSASLFFTSDTTAILSGGMSAP